MFAMPGQTEPAKPPRMLWRAEAMKQLHAQAQLLAKESIPVLISGETGTGKEVLARTIHDMNGDRRPFIPIDCTGFPADLLESELFGYVKGAFTGAVGDKPGLIALAEGGTAFFDEIGGLPLYLQSKLLRLLQEREYRPVGSCAFKRAGCRVIAAVNVNLLAEVRAGRFREDLYYRLAVAHLRIPPLRSRREDIPVLIQFFLRRLQSELQLPAAVVNQLSAGSWPGNVRQLENCIMCMVSLNCCPLLGNGEMSCDTLASIRAVQAELDQGTQLPRSDVADKLALESLAHYEYVAICNALRRTNGNRERASEILGIGRTTLYRKLQCYNLRTWCTSCSQSPQSTPPVDTGGRPIRRPVCQADHVDDIPTLSCAIVA